MLSVGLSSCCGPLSGRCSLLWRHFIAFTERGFLCARGYACALTWCALFGYARPTQAHAHFPQDICCGSLPRHVAINHCLCEHKHNIKRHFYAHDKFVRVRQSKPLDKLTIQIKYINSIHDRSISLRSDSIIPFEFCICSYNR